MKIVPVLVLSSLSLLGCSSTQKEYKSTYSTNIAPNLYKICPKKGDSVSDGMLLTSLKSSMLSSSKFSPVHRVDGTSDVHIYKGLNLNIQNGTFKAAYLHRHSTEMDRTKNLNIDSYFEATATYKISNESQCLVFRFSSPFSYDIKTRRTIIFTEVEQLDSPKNLERDLLSSLKNAQPIIRIAKNFNHSATKNTSNLEPKDIATDLQIKHGIDAKKIEDKYIVTTTLKLTEKLSAVLDFQVLPYKKGSIIQYSAKIPYYNEYLGNGSSDVLSNSDLEKLSALVDDFISNIIES